MSDNKLSAVVKIDGIDYEVTAKNAEQLGGVAASSYALKSDLVAETKLTIVNKTQSDTADTVYAVTNLAEDPNNQNGHYVTPTYTAVPTKKYVDDNKQAKLVSGTNIKTVNGESLLGSGDITITGGGASNSDMLKSVYDTNNNGKVDTAENAEKLGGTVASDYAKKSDIPNITISKNEPTSGATGDIWFKY